MYPFSLEFDIIACFKKLEDLILITITNIAFYSKQPSKIYDVTGRKVVLQERL